MGEESFVLAKKLVHENTDFPAFLMAIVGPMGSVNGYLLVEKDSPWYGKHYDELNEICDVHGGWTYSESGEVFAETVMLIPMAQGEGAEILSGMWVFGFDTLHLGDALSEEFTSLVAYGDSELEKILSETRLKVFSNGHVWTPDEVISELEHAYGELVRSYEEYKALNG